MASSIVSFYHTDVHIYRMPLFTTAQEHIYTMLLLSSYPFPSLCLLDGVELTGAESFTVSGSKDKLQNTHAEVTYVFVRLPDSFSSPARSLSPSLSLFLASSSSSSSWFFFSSCFLNPALIFSFCLSEHNEFLRTANWFLALCD